MNSVWLQVTSGRCPAECQWVVARLTKHIIGYCSTKSVKVEILETIAGDQRGTFKSSLLSLQGDINELCIKRYSGTVLWHGQSPFRPHHKRKNWYVGVDPLIHLESNNRNELHLELDREIHIETFRASGPGGQNVNRRESAVRITHQPTGISVVGREERSQLMNRRLALARLRSKLSENTQNSQSNADKSRWQQHNQLERGNPVLKFEGIHFKEKH